MFNQVEKPTNNHSFNWRSIGNDPHAYTPYKKQTIPIDLVNPKVSTPIPNSLSQ